MRKFFKLENDRSKETREGVLGGKDPIVLTNACSA